MKIQHLILTATTALFAGNAYSATTYTYDANGRVIEEIDGSEQYVYTYDAKGNKIESVCTGCPFYIPPVQKWTYDENNRILSQSYYKANGTQGSHNEYTYDTDGTQTQIYYNNSPSSKYVTTYDLQGNPTSKIFYNGSSNITDGKPSIRYEYAYDGNKKTEFVYDCDYSGTCNIPANKTEFTYDENGNQTSYTSYSCSGGSCTTPVSKVEYTYDEHNNRTSETYYSCYGGPCPSTPSSQYEYTYDYDKYGNVTAKYTNGSLSVSHTYDPEFIKKQWLEHRKLIYTIEEAQARIKEIGKDHVTFRIRYK